MTSGTWASPIQMRTLEPSGTSKPASGSCCATRPSSPSSGSGWTNPESISESPRAVSAACASSRVIAVRSGTSTRISWPTFTMISSPMMTSTPAAGSCAAMRPFRPLAAVTSMGSPTVSTRPRSAIARRASSGVRPTRLGRPKGSGPLDTKIVTRLPRGTSSSPSGSERITKPSSMSEENSSISSMSLNPASARVRRALSRASPLTTGIVNANGPVETSRSTAVP